jgi:hypothetical protein
MFPFVVCAILYLRNKAKTREVSVLDQPSQNDIPMNALDHEEPILVQDNALRLVLDAGEGSHRIDITVAGEPLEDHESENFHVSTPSQDQPDTKIQSLTRVLFPHLVCLHYYTIDPSDHCLWLSHVSESAIVLSRFSHLDSVSVVVCEDADNFEFVDSRSLVVMEIATDDLALLQTLNEWAAISR